MSVLLTVMNIIDSDKMAAAVSEPDLYRAG
jgi:hypothetical protein